MLSEPEIQRFSRHILLREIGGAGQVKLRRACVRIPALDADGRACALWLARAGIGALALPRDTTPAPASDESGLLLATDAGRPLDEACRERLVAHGLDLQFRDAAEFEAASSGGAEAALAVVRRIVVDSTQKPARTRRLAPLETVAEVVGNTPLVRVTRCLPPLKHVEIWAKLEWFNPGGSVKDRAARSMIERAISEGKMSRTQPLIDSTSGNTGIAYSMLGAALGYPVTLVMPDNVSAARKRITRAFGAKQIFTDPLEQSDGAIRAVRKLVAEHPDEYFYPDQYSNDANPEAHARTTAREVWDQTRGRLTHFVAGLGTSGTVMGTRRGLKAIDPRIQVVAVEPKESLHGLEGLKHMPSSIVPAIYDESVLDRKLSISTDDGWEWAERLCKEEGLLAGHSAGAALAGALVVAQELEARGEAGVVVALFPDRADRYYEPPQKPPARPPCW